MNAYNTTVHGGFLRWSHHPSPEVHGNWHRWLTLGNQWILWTRLLFFFERIRICLNDYTNPNVQAVQAFLFCSCLLYHMLNQCFCGQVSSFRLDFRVFLGFPLRRNSDDASIHVIPWCDGPAKSDKPPIWDGWKPINNGITTKRMVETL